jgi:hypothetical protein
VLQLKRQDIALVNNVTYLGVTFDRWMTLKRHIERIVAKALRTYGRSNSVFRSGRLSTDVKLTLYKAVIRSIMTYAYPTLEYAAGAHLLKLQRLQNRALRATGNLDGCTPDRELHLAFKTPYVYDYIIM